VAFYAPRPAGGKPPRHRIFDQGRLPQQGSRLRRDLQVEPPGVRRSGAGDPGRRRRAVQGHAPGRQGCLQRGPDVHRAGRGGRVPVPRRRARRRETGLRRVPRRIQVLRPGLSAARLPPAVPSST